MKKTQIFCLCNTFQEYLCKFNQWLLGYTVFRRFRAHRLGFTPRWLHRALPSLFSGHQLLLWTGEQRTYRNLGSLRKTAVGRGFVWMEVFYYLITSNDKDRCRTTQIKLYSAAISIQVTCMNKYYRKWLQLKRHQRFKIQKLFFFIKT